jgi:excinuclease ABC subunit A
MDVQEALQHFENIPAIHHKLQTLHDVGLDYMKLGQPSPTLSGGEAQRVKLARELVKMSAGRTLYLLDEPTTGLHFADIQLLLKVLHAFVDAGNTVLVVEHNSEVIKTADWIIDLGPEGGEAGGYLVATGTPEDIARKNTKKREGDGKNRSTWAIARGDSAACPEFTSYTGQILQKVLAGAHTSQSLQASAAAAQHPAPPSPQPPLSIRIRGARQHNLKDLDVDIPRDTLTVFCGPSGSGKSSLAMDTIYAEGQRRYVESLSSYARQFVGQMQKPKVDHIAGLSPAVAIEQKHAGATPRSTVGTVTEIYDYLRILMSRLGQPHCPVCDLAVGSQSADEIIAKLMAQPAGTKLYVMAPLEIHVGERYETLWAETRAAGYARIRVDRQTYSIDEPPQIDRRRKHDVEVVIDRVTILPDARSRLAGSVESALSLGRGVLRAAYPREGVAELHWHVETHSQHFVCDRCGRSFEPLSPHNFSFNSALGWCPACEGLGTQVGANPATLLRDPKLTLAQGAVGLWPGIDNQIFSAMLAAFSRATGIPADVPFDSLGARHRRLIFHGTGEQWFDVHRAADGGRDLLFRFQYKGLYPALEEASRLSPALRGRLEHLVDEVECSVCCGSRLRDDATAVKLPIASPGRTIDELCRLSLGKLLEDFQHWKLSGEQRKIAGEVAREIRSRLQFLVDVGLEYLTLGRPAPTLSGGEMQRIRLAAQVGSGLCGVLYVLDEPTIGLHPRDNRRLLNALKRLRDLGNTLLVVEHDREVLRSADQVLDFGPAAGRGGGQVVAQGTPAHLAKQRGSVTGPYLSGDKAIPVPTNRRMRKNDNRGMLNDKVRPRQSRIRHSSFIADQSAPGGWLEIVGARHNNLKNITVRIPLGTLTAVTGVSGSGKSSLIEDVLFASLARTLHRAQTSSGAHDAIHGVQLVNKVIRVDQQPLGQTPTSNPATFTGTFDLIRALYSQLPEAKLRGYTPRRFSFNVAGGRCEKCEGNGQLRIEMHFLPDVWVECDTCGGRRYNPETLAVRYHGRSIADVLDMSCGEAVRLFADIPKIRRPLQVLCDVGLDYLTLGQPAPTLSGGEAQRVKLAAELARPDTGRTLYVLDEPTTGLHFDDLAKLLDVLNRLVDLGNTVVVIEHNLDVVKTADWVIDLGPEAGDGGGYLVAAGTPEDIVERRGERGEGREVVSGAESGHRSPSYLAPHPSPLLSHTATALAPVLAAGPLVSRKVFDFAAEMAAREGDREISDVGGDARMPWEIDGRHWHTVDRVGRAGNPCRWDGRILAEVIDRIQQSDLFAETNWNSRSVVEISAAKKADGWFFHAITGEEWLLKMKFRTARHTFQREDLVDKLGLKPLNDVPELPLYGTEPRVRCKNLRGPWQEVELRVHNHSEINRTEFWEFVDHAVAGFAKFTNKVQQKSDILHPWKQLGRTWHFARKGFSIGKKIHWEAEVLEDLMEMLAETAPHGQFLWNNKQVVPVYLPKHREPWAAVQTKKLDAVYLRLSGPKGRFTLGQITELGYNPELDGQRSTSDVIRLKFRTAADLARGNLRAFLKEHLATVQKK